MGTEPSGFVSASDIRHRGEWGVFPSCNSYLSEKTFQWRGRRGVYTGIGIESSAVLALAVHYPLPPSLYSSTTSTFQNLLVNNFVNPILTIWSS